MASAKNNAEYMALQERKRYWITAACNGKCSIKSAASHIGITPFSVTRLKKRYRLEGDGAFVNRHKGRHFKHEKYSIVMRAKICAIYREKWQGANFAFFCDILQENYNIKISVSTLKKILNGAGIVSPKARGKYDKKVHKPRKEREKEGELLQLDASFYDWFMNSKPCALHGAIDDATHKIAGLYMTANECRLGYNEVFRQVLEKHGVPLAVYTDRHAAFVKNARKKSKTALERLEYSKNEVTFWTDLCKRLNIEIILALSPQGKGRIERLWQTLQSRLPFIFRFYGITTIEKANEFLQRFIFQFNNRFSVPAQNTKKAYKQLIKTRLDLDYLLQIKTQKRTDKNGCFVFHGFTFKLCAPRACYVDFTLCMSEKFGVRAFINGSYYHVQLVDDLTDCIGDAMPQVEKDLVARYCLADLHASGF